MANHPADASGFCQELLMLGRWHAARRGLNGEDAEDCAVEFALNIFTRLHSAQEEGGRSGSPMLPDPDWLHQRAHTHTRNFQRTVFTYADRFCSLRLLERREMEGSGGEIEAPLLQTEFWKHIFAALDSLDAVPRQLLIGRQLHRQSIGTLAANCGRSEHAVEQTLVRARQQMRRVLERRGCNEAILREYVAAFAPPAPLCRTKHHAVVRSVQRAGMTSLPNSEAERRGAPGGQGCSSASLT